MRYNFSVNVKVGAVLPLTQGQPQRYKGDIPPSTHTHTLPLTCIRWRVGKGDRKMKVCRPIKETYIVEAIQNEMIHHRS